MVQDFLGIEWRIKMSAKRLISDEQRLKLRNSKIHKGKQITDFSSKEKDELLEILAKKAGIL